MLKHIFLNYDSSDKSGKSDNKLWDYWERLHQLIDQENNKYEWNKIYMLKNVENLTIMVHKKTDEVVGFYMGRYGINGIKVKPKAVPNPRTKVAPKGRYGTKVSDTENSTKVAPKGRYSTKVSDTENSTKVAPKGRYSTKPEETEDPTKVSDTAPTKAPTKILTIDIIQAFDQNQGYGTLMLIHAAHKVGMKYHNTDNLKNYIIIKNSYKESIGFYEKYNLEMI